MRGGRDGSDASVSGGMPKIAGKLQKLGRGKERLCYVFQREHDPADNWIADI